MEGLSSKIHASRSALSKASFLILVWVCVCIASTIVTDLVTQIIFTVESLGVDCVCFHNTQLWEPISTNSCHLVGYLTCTKETCLLAKVWACVASD